MKYPVAGFLFALFLFAGCGKPVMETRGILFKDDLAFLKRRTKVIVLSGEDGLARLAVNPDLQGRIMTSTAGGDKGMSFGWINRKLIASGRTNLHINAFGGEDRFWLGPEGGQFSIFFKKDDPFDLDHWFTPPPINDGAYEVAAREPDRILFRKSMRLVNYANTEFHLELARLVRLLDRTEVGELGIDAPAGVPMVAFQSDNRITNTGPNAWAKETGLLSIWILGMFNPSASTAIVIPFKPGPESDLGPVVNDAYFGRVPPERLKIKENVLFFSGDGRYRSKIGISPRRVKPYLGSYDAAGRVLTIAHITLPGGSADYVNSMWEIQKEPYGGDVVNSYNDGPASPGAEPLGPFYELESSSPAAALQPGESLRHIHTTIHLQGEEGDLDAVATQVFGVGIREIRTALGAEN
ncbi:MAG TPA: hypothetical protein PLX50_02250 [Candidatus Aminicenantes bacterium]|nr:hypothetical protein [Candidatus Aminicenantes bacterium]